MDTVFKVLKVTVEKARKLFLEEVDIVFDHAIYSKGLEIIMNPIHEDLRATESTEFQQLLNCPSAECMQQCLDSYGDVANEVYEFEDELRNGTMSSFSQSYIDIIQILFDYLRSIRLAD